MCQPEKIRTVLSDEFTDLLYDDGVGCHLQTKKMGSTILAGRTLTTEYEQRFKNTKEKYFVVLCYALKLIFISIMLLRFLDEEIAAWC